MGYYPVYPAVLSRGEFARVRFTLEMVSGCRLDPGTLLGLRRPLRIAAAGMPVMPAAELFDTPPGVDPVARRRYQKPAPGFVVHVDAAGAAEVLEGDRLHVELLLLGRAIPWLGDFARIVARLGRQGLAGGDGRFDLAGIEIATSDGGWRPLPAPVRPELLVPDLLRLDHWLESRWPPPGPLALQFSTPLRLLADGRVLRRPRFDQLFPFLLRRATSMLHAWCDLDAIDDPASLLAAARACTSRWITANWLDWRETGHRQPVGGLLGTLQIDGPDLDSLLWVLLLATLLGAGKGAAYGAGRCRLAATDLLAGGQGFDIIRVRA